MTVIINGGLKANNVSIGPYVPPAPPAPTHPFYDTNGVYSISVPVGYTLATIEAWGPGGSGSSGGGGGAGTGGGGTAHAGEPSFGPATVVLTPSLVRLNNSSGPLIVEAQPGVNGPDGYVLMQPGAAGGGGGGSFVGGTAGTNNVAASAGTVGTGATLVVQHHTAVGNSGSAGGGGQSVFSGVGAGGVGGTGATAAAGVPSPIDSVAYGAGGFGGTGGAGGEATSGNTSGAGGGGGASGSPGGYIQVTYPVTPGQVLYLQVGLGQVFNNNGAFGGTNSFYGPASITAGQEASVGGGGSDGAIRITYS